MNKAIIFFICSLPFFNFYVAPNISFSDVGMIILVLSMIFSKKNILFYFKNKGLIFVYLLFLWSIIAIIILNNNATINYIDYFGFFKNILRFLFVIYLFINSRILFRSGKRIKLIFSTWIRVVKFVCILGIIEFFLQFFGIYYSYYFDGITTTTGRTLEKFFRISSVFNEPSYLGIYLNFSLVVLYELKKRLNFLSIKQFSNLIYYVLLTLLLSRSLSGFLLFFIVLVLYKNYIFSARLVRYKLVSFMIIGILGIGAFFINYQRLNDVATQNDGSTNHRFLGSYELFNAIYEDFALTGTGLGQQKNFLNSSHLTFQNHYYMQDLNTGSGINNLFVLFFFQLGLIGLFLFILVLYYIFINNKKLFLFIIISCFGWAYMFNPLFWFSISILNVIINGKQKNIIYIN